MSFQAMGHEIERYENEISTIEDQELELMVQADKIKAELGEEEKKAGATKDSISRQLVDLDEKSKALEGRLQELTKERAELAAKIDEDLLDRFDRLIREQRRRGHRRARTQCLHRLPHESDDGDRHARQSRQRNRQLRAVRADRLRSRVNVRRSSSPSTLDQIARETRRYTRQESTLHLRR